MYLFQSIYYVKTILGTENILFSWLWSNTVVVNAINIQSIIKIIYLALAQGKGIETVFRVPIQTKIYIMNPYDLTIKRF